MAKKVEQKAVAQGFRRLDPGEIPKKGDAVLVQDGPGKVEWVKGAGVQVKLDSGYLFRGGIDMLRVKK